VRRKNDTDRTEIKQGRLIGVLCRVGYYSIVSVGKPAPIPLTARSKAWVCGRFLAEIVGSYRAGGIDVCYECSVLSGSGLCDVPIPCLWESAECVCVFECDQVEQ
jgi:hypothetical protein